MCLCMCVFENVWMLLLLLTITGKLERDKDPAAISHVLAGLACLGSSKTVGP